MAGGADLDSVAGGATPLEDAVGYGCWHVARFLAGRGARVDQLWVAAALGWADRVEALMASSPPGRSAYARDPATVIARRLDTRREGLVAWLAGLG